MLLRGDVVTSEGVLANHIVTVEGDRIAAVAPAGRTRKVHSRARWIVPGFIDLHVHGGGGHTFTEGDPAQARAAAEFHLAHGTTTMLASLVTAPPDALRDATVAFAALVDDGTLAGIHYEGPYVSSARCGAQNPAYLRDPDLEELSALIDLGGVAMVTIAPELPRALEASALLAERGVLAAVGHTDATYEQTMAAIDAGARVGTHVCNAMRPVHHRDPGPIVALLDAPSVICEQVADGVHLHPATLRHSVRAAGADRVALITDAMAAAGMPDGRYELGGQPVRVSAGVARLESDATIAGSTLTMDAAVRNTVHNGLPIVDVVRMAATTPARALGLDDDRGRIAVGLRADLVLLDEALHVVGVVRGGVPVGADSTG
jgi:N-acetylglucosamine-6-phosphate deacetylase